MADADKERPGPSAEDLLQLLRSDGADGLTLEPGRRPIIELDGVKQELGYPSLSREDVERLLHSLTDTRKRRELRENGRIHFVHRFRDIADFVIEVRLQDEAVVIEVH
jgi:Tfp pilus assembly pilus retraction ATPase PilT